MTFSVVKPILIKSNDIRMHRNFYNNLKGRKLTSDLDAEFHNVKNFDCTLDTVTNSLAKVYEYKNSIKIFSKKISALHIDGDNCINCLVNVDEKSSKGLIVLDSEFEKLKHSRLYTGKIQDTLDFFNIKDIYETEILPGEILIFNSNNYHSFDCNTGVKLLVHKFINHTDTNNYNPIYI
jgi:hypothetical protein